MEEASTAAKEDEPHLKKQTWKPTPKAFHLYSVAPNGDSSEKSGALRVVVRKPLVLRLTTDLVETYKICNPTFKYSEALNPKRYLTSPSVGVLNDGYDNANSDLILSVNYVLVNAAKQQRYIVKDLLGHGTFGQVAKCWVSETNSYVAVKIIKNQPAFFQQAKVEVNILSVLNEKYDPEDNHHIVRMLDYFVFQRHLCISFELLETNLYELIKMNQFRGLSLGIVQLFSRQILRALILMKEAGIIHCDLKPENILLCASVKPAEIKIIDFGSACSEHRPIYSYIQSRYYRSPEVLLGHQYTTAIDMWSFGCIVAELFLGLPLFPGASEYDLLRRMIKILGAQPPDHLLNEAKYTDKFFKRAGDILDVENNETSFSSIGSFQVLTEEEFEARDLKRPLIGKEYFNHMKLEEIVTNYPPSKRLTEEEMSKDKSTRLAMIDFLRGLIEFDPSKRWSPLQASGHPFVTGEPFTCPYKPPPETTRMFVTPNFKVDHRPAAGHWIPAGFSPQVSSMNRGPAHNSLHFQMVPYSHAGSYGSLGSHGSYNEGGLGSSCGSYGDDSSLYGYYSPAGPSGLTIHAQGAIPIFGASPDARRRTSQFSHGNGLGVGSTANFGPMSLGASPSQFTPPSNIQVSSGSPGKYGPSSPARGSGVHGSPLGKVAVVGQFNKRRSWVHPGSFSTQAQENNSSSLRQGNFTDTASCSYPEGNARPHGGSPRGGAQSNTNMPNWRQHRGGVRFNSVSSSNAVQQTTGSFSFSDDKPDSSSIPDPGDWDPNYSDELLLQEDVSDTSSLTSDFANGMRLGHSLNSGVATAGVARQYRASYSVHSGYHPSSQRVTGAIQGYSNSDVGSPPSAHDLHVGFGRPPSKPSHLMPHFSQNSPSRFGHQHGLRPNYAPSTFVHVGSDWMYPNFHPPLPNCNAAGPRSPGSSTFSNSVPWGRRSGLPVASIPPMSHARKDY
ncbi:hypothetical protein Syun_017958 [Stephania yunnanensis]|uniref:Protein kinase domain-containing protein n=1 Tax=Stephania yunnanensis TaxID=152371 RepID=A0AAP0NXX1_9MAGN